MKKIDPTILIIDDDDADCLLIKNAFKKIGVTSPLHCLNDGEEAIAYLMGEGKYADRKKFHYPSFILTDLKMPRLDGFGVLEFLKGNPEWAVIPVIVLSGSADPDDIKRSYQMGASSYHIKPATSEALIRQILVLHAYWMTCEVPEVDSTGRQVMTKGSGKLGERFPQVGEKGGTQRSSGIKRMRPKNK
jgi:CheY-like chemotaxis protein